jgi:trimethylamine--corrinoid protein Co-methyltransferase
MRIPYYDLVGPEQLDLVHDMSMRILEEAGLAFYDDESLSILREHGAAVGDDSVVRFDRGLIEEYVSHAPAEFMHTARNPVKSIVIGGDHIAFAPAAGPPFVLDPVDGRRQATLDDLVNFIKLTMVSPYLHSQGTEIVVPNDVPFHERALDITYAHIKHGDMPIMGHYPIGLAAEDSLEMARILFGSAAMETTHVMHCTVNVSSPRRLDGRMLGTLKAYAGANQIVMMTPFILAGAMGPATILGTVAQANAEALAGIAFTQMVRKGAPSIFGPFLAVIDLQSGSPVFGAAESTLAQFVLAQLARRYRLPFRAAGTYVSSKIADSQAGYEGAMSMLPSMLCGPNYVLHAAGWLENGLTTGYAKFMLDCELLGVLQRLAAGIDWDEDEWAMDSILAVPPGGHHLGTEHTFSRFRTAFHRTPLFDAESFETWSLKGSLDATTRASGALAEAFGRYEPPPLDEAIDEELGDYMERRRGQIDPAAFQ